MERINLASIVINEILSIFPIELKENEDKQMFNRHGTGFIFAEKGQLEYRMDGQTFVSDQNHLLLLPSGATYSILSVTESISLLINTISTGYNCKNAHICSFKINAPSSFFSAFHRLDNIWTFKKDAHKLKCMAGLYDLLAKIHEMNASPYAPDYKYDQINKSITYLEEHYNNPNLTNELIAFQSNISTVYFRKLFTEKYGMSPMKFVKNKRIEKAQEMLREDESSITRIADSVGFTSINNFSRSFKAFTGYSPQEYRRISIHKKE